MKTDRSNEFPGRNFHPTVTDISVKQQKDAGDSRAPRDPFRGLDQFGYLRGSSPPMRRLYRMLRKVGHSEASILLSGESGTGKELAARTLHSLSPRANGPFVAFNCAAVPATLIESELFGHEKGSFSGAVRRHEGFFEQARGGTLLLDEITEMNIDLQARFLRVLESRRFRRVGSESDTAMDVRIISATNRNPEQAVAQGQLRQDLYYRLAQITVSLPPLRERGEEDITGLARHFLGQLNELHGTRLRFAPDTLQALLQYRWPGNVRELRHAVECAYILSDELIRPSALPPPRESLAGNGTAHPGAAQCIQVPLGKSLASAERRIILANLEKNSGNRKDTARDLGISVKTLYNRLQAYKSEET